MQIRNSVLFRWLTIAPIALVALLWAPSIGPRAQQSAMAADAKDQPYVIEYYYKAKWGHAEEFLALFKKNHIPFSRRRLN